MSQNFANFLQETRKAAGFKSQRALSEKTKVSNATIARIENGKQIPLPKTLKKLSPSLKVSYRKLMQVAGYLDSENHSRRKAE